MEYNYLKKLKGKIRILENKINSLPEYGHHFKNPQKKLENEQILYLKKLLNILEKNEDIFKYKTILKIKSENELVEEQETLVYLYNDSVLWYVTDKRIKTLYEEIIKRSRKILNKGFILIYNDSILRSDTKEQ